MSNTTPQKVPQIDCKKTANYTAKGDMQVVNNYYQDDSPVEVRIDIWDLLGLAFLVLGILFVGGLAVWSLYEVGLKIWALWGWVAKNWRFILTGFIAVSTVIGATAWYFVTYTKDETDKDLL